MAAKKNPAQNSITLKSINLLFCTAPIMCTIFITMEIVFCLIPILSSKVISQIVDAFTSFYDIKINNLTMLVAFYVFMNISVQALSPVRSMIAERLSDKVAKESEMLFNSKIISLNSINCFENNEFFNEMQLARNGCGQRLISSLQMISSLLRGVITISLTAGYMISIHWVIGSISLLAVIPNTLYNYWVSKNKVALFRSQAESSRKLSYFSSLLSSPTYAKEVRLFGLGEYIINKYKGLFNSEYRRINKTRNKQCWIGIICASIGALVNGVALMMFIAMAISSKATVGDITLYISLLPQFIGGLQMLINGFQQTKNNNYYIKHFFDFVERDFGDSNGLKRIENQDGVQSITVENLWFRYPNSEKHVLRNISFAVNKPALIAIVGENGSGKSTLIKLLMRLFDTTTGTIAINDTSIKEYDIIELRKRMSGVFQDPAKFSFTVRENLSFATHEKDICETDMWEACDKAGLKTLFEQSSSGLDTMLGKQFEGGTELSGGQWQKLSLARAFLSNASVLFFDEASSDLDPTAEQAFYQSVREYAKNKIAFYITHRLSGTKDADLLIVMKDGEIAEIGNHKDLISKNGEYSKLYNAQVAGYELN